MRYSAVFPRRLALSAARTLVFAWLTFQLAAGAGAQETRSRLFRDVILGSGLHFQRWSGEEDLEVREFSLPLVFVWPVSRRLSLDVVTGSGLATLERGTSTSLKGLTDTKIRGSCILGDEVALLTAGVSTPTGKTRLDSLEQDVSNYLAQDALGFRTPSFGQGLDLNFGLAVAHRLGGTVFGLGVGYLRKGGFTPQFGDPEYQPGSELNLTFGLDRQVMDGDGQLTLDVVYTQYGEDEQGGKPAFQSGDKVLAQALGRFRGAGLNWRVHLIERFKAESTSYEEEEPEEFSNGNEFEAGLAAMTGGSGRLSLGGAADLKLYGDNDFDQGEAAIWSAGPGIRLRLSSRSFIDLSARYARGEIDAAEVSGIDIRGGIWIRL